MSNNTTYNGWTNYATWRVNLEIFDGGDWEGMGAQSFKDLAEEHIMSQSEGIAQDYALAFLSDVNWDEISSHYTEEKESEGLEEFFVDLIEEGQEEAIVFECWAEDAEHAKEQAENSYPDCVIVSII